MHRVVSLSVFRICVQYIYLIHKDTDDTVKREEEEQWRYERREIRDVEVTEVRDSSGPLGKKAVNRTLLMIHAALMLCLCVYNVYERVCVCAFLHIKYGLMCRHI